MSGRLPLVTVLVCAFDYERYVAAALDSALAQDYTGPIELLVVDDGSTDGTPEILAGYGDRIRVVRQGNAGLNAATARGIAEARGDVVALLDADDVWRADKLRRQVELLVDRPEVGLVFSDMALMDAAGTPVAPSYFRHHGLHPPRGRALGALLRQSLVPAPTIAFRRALADHVLPVADAASFQDWWLALKVAEVAELDWVDEPLVSYRLHGDNMASGAQGEKWARNVRADLRFRRWMLANLDLRAVAATDLRVGAARLDHDATAVARSAGTSPAAELAAGDDDRLAWASALLRAHAARAAGDARAAALAALAAVAADPAEPTARRELAELLDRLEAGEDERPVAVHDVAEAVGHADPSARLAAAEDAFGRGDVPGARRRLVALVAEPGLVPAVAAAARNDLAVIAVASGDLETARREALAAAVVDPAYAPAAETLGRCAEAEQDIVQAGHWFARALRLDPGDESLEAALAVARAARRRPAPAASPEPSTVPPGGRGRVLICVDRFVASADGRIGVELRRLGWHVEFAATSASARVHAGMRIHDVHAREAAAVARIVERGAIDAVLALADPRAWPLPAVCALPDGGARRVVVPRIDADTLAHLLADDARIAAHLELVHRADAHVHASLAGLDARLAERLPIASTHVPDGADRHQPGAGVPGDGPLVLAGDADGSAGLLPALATAASFRLALIGGADITPDTARLRALAAVDGRVHARPAPAAAMHQADVLLVPESAPELLVTAMAHGLPWIATPRCETAPDLAGGLVLPSRDIAPGLAYLLDHPAERAALGAAGRAHWEAAHRWEVAGARYDALLSGAGALPPLAPPPAAIARTDAVRAAQLDALAEPIPAPPMLQEALR